MRKKSFSECDTTIYISDVLTPDEVIYIQGQDKKLEFFSGRKFDDSVENIARKMLALYYSKAPSEKDFRHTYSYNLIVFNVDNYVEDCNRLMKRIIKNYKPRTPLVEFDADDTYSTEIGELILKKELNRAGWLVQTRSLLNEYHDYEYTLLAKKDMKKYPHLKNTFITEEQQPRYTSMKQFHRSYLREFY